MCVQYIGGYHEYIEGCLVHRRDIMMHVGGYYDACGEQVDKILSISIENPEVLNIPDVLMISPNVLNIP